MSNQPRFSAADSLGAFDNREVADYLLSIGDDAGAAQLLGQRAGQSFGLGSTPWKHTGFAVGYIGPTSGTGASVPVVPAGGVDSDTSLIGTRIKITIDKFHVQEYPGMGVHEVLCEFAGKNQVAAEVEEMRFALRTAVRDGESASISGHPIFLGVTVGKDGISFEGRSINVANNLDKTVLEILDSPAFKSGLSLLTTAQPALKPFSSLAASVVKATAERNKNRQIHSFNLGLDFGSSATSSRLRLGSYVVMQSDGVKWDWNNFLWDRNSMSLQPKSAAVPVPQLNYMVFGVGQFSPA
jgi:hypothetical protein